MERNGVLASTGRFYDDYTQGLLRYFMSWLYDLACQIQRTCATMSSSLLFILVPKYQLYLST